MRTSRIVALAALAGSVALFVVAARAGELSGGLFVIFPFVMGSGLASFGAVLLLMVALVAFFLSMAPLPLDDVRRADEPDDAAPTDPAETRHGGVMLLGPIPIVWGSDRGIAKWMVAAGALLLVLGILVVLL